MLKNGHLAEPLRSMVGPGPGRGAPWPCVPPLEDFPGACEGWRSPLSPLDRAASNPIQPSSVLMKAGAYARLLSRGLA
ncbi:hypothetical protein NDU88_001755 [Pleurodeles waltl]|uniref:Uncharacterized protein n=1 Tax=Pleurodeles waltl TaxID=8319 RepID=A0AAV7M930_PLEWA|nr:hypothetical protein NDU88_001755 [Pleurodeles waltl]